MSRWLVVALFAVAGCAVYDRGIRSDATLKPDRAYLYGRFFMKAEAQYGSVAGKQSMGLVIRCENGSSYNFGSIDKRDVQVLEVRPGRCWLTEAILADQNGMVRKLLKAERSMQRPLDFKAGRAHYLGDYFSRGDFSTRPGVFVHYLLWQWAMDPADDRYDETTAEMKSAFPALASLPTIDTRLIPAAPPRKRGNQIAAAPDEPPLSPERVARIAPFIKRDHATPAKCEAACPTGQCLPYRGESGPTMACIIRCDKDKDCPEGSACNCPNSERPAAPECQPIATTPGDSMARICLPVESGQGVGADPSP
jgi:hypothetical protein